MQMLRRSNRPVLPASSFCTRTWPKAGVRQAGTRRTMCEASSSNPSMGGEQDLPASSDPSTSYMLPWDEEQPRVLPANYSEIRASIQHMDNNQLQTALGVAIAAEDYALAGRIKSRLQQKLRESGSSIVSQSMDWRALGVPDWLADRAERLGFMFPTEVQRRSTPVVLSGSDAVIASETGSGKTAACLVPALAMLDYPPELFPDDLEGPQLLLLVPSFELGVQACLLLYKLWGGNISSRMPGDPANMFSYTGPLGIKVRGLLNDEELKMAVAGRYLKGVHALVTTPDLALALLSLQDSPLNFQDLRAIVVDEMDALLEAYPASFGQLMDAAVSRQQAALGSSTPALQQQLDAAASNNSSSSSSTPGSSPSEQERQQQGPQDNMAKLEELLQRQQQREQQQRSRSGDTTEGPAAAASASLAAAAARLEGLMAVSAVTPPGEAAAPPLKQQQSEEAAAAADDAAVPVDPVGDSLAEGKQPPPQPITPAAAAGDDSDESPMAKPQVVLVGATVSDDDVVLALQRQWVKEPVLVRVGEPGCVPAGLRHRAIVVSGPDRKLAGLVGSLRTDLTNALAVADAAAAAASGSGVVDPAFASSSNSAAGAGHAGPVRVIIFAPSEAEAQGAAEPLRSALWGDHMLAVLLPSSGAEPIKALHAFRDRVASLLLATPSAARGLDLPAVSHVYSLGLPQDVTEYVHRAGRAGRIGSTSGGEVCTVVTQEELPELQGMLDDLGLHLDVVDLGTQPGLGLLGNDWAAAKEGLLLGRSDDEQDGEPLDAEALSTEASQQDAGKLETARKGLEDLFNLL